MKCIEIKAGICSDHSMVNFELVVHNSDKGRGLFRFDNTLLEDIEFVNTHALRSRRPKSGKVYTKMLMILGLKIEMLTSEIRVKSMKLGSWKGAQEERKRAGFFRG